MNPEEVKRKAASGAVRLSSGGPERPVPGLDSLSICPAQLSGTFPADIFEGIETDVVMGEKQARDPLTLMVPVFLPGVPFGQVGHNARLGLAYGASLAQTAFGTGDCGAFPEELEICKQFHGKLVASWGPARFGVTPEYINGGNAVVVELCGGPRGPPRPRPRCTASLRASTGSFPRPTWTWSIPRT
jgi:glutamate synthase domain-containing protein 2